MSNEEKIEQLRAMIESLCGRIDNLEQRVLGKSVHDPAGHWRRVGAPPWAVTDGRWTMEEIKCATGAGAGVEPAITKQDAYQIILEEITQRMMHFELTEFARNDAEAYAAREKFKERIWQAMDIIKQEMIGATNE